MHKLNDLSRSLTVLNGDSTLIVVIEMGQSSWLVAGIVPGVERQLASDAAASTRHSRRPRASSTAGACISTGQKFEGVSGVARQRKRCGCRNGLFVPEVP